MRIRKSTKARSTAPVPAYGYRRRSWRSIGQGNWRRDAFVGTADPVSTTASTPPIRGKTGLNQLPYSKEAIASLKKFRDDVLKMEMKGKIEELDSQPFSKFLAAYTPELTKWWDALAPQIGAPLPKTLPLLSASLTPTICSREATINGSFCPAGSLHHPTSWLRS